MRCRRILRVGLAAAVVFHAGAATRHRSNITLRKRLHVNTLITDPGTVEIDWSGLYSTLTGHWQSPATIKYTPAGPHILWGRTEYAIGYDGSQLVTATGTAVVFDGDKLDVAIAPGAGFFVRDELGARLGAVAIARYDWGQNSAGVTLSWSGATHSSDTNPAGVWDAGFGYGRRLSAHGWASHLTPHMNAVWDKPSGQQRTLSWYEGVEYQANERIAIDLSGQHVGLGGPVPDHQAVIGLTVNLGKLH